MKIHRADDETEIRDDDANLVLARKYATNGKKFLEEHVPGWLERAQKSSVFEMGVMDYCALAISCKGAKLRGRDVYTAGDVVRAFPDVGIGSNHPEMGFYAEHDAEVNYDHLQIAWEEIFGRGVILRAA